MIIFLLPPIRIWRTFTGASQLTLACAIIPES